MRSPHAFALGQLDRLQGFFPRNEGKAAFLFAANVGMLAVMAQNYPYSHPHNWLGLLVLAAFVLIVLSLSQLWGVFMPHTDGAAMRSVLYFGDIAATAVADYRQRLETITDDELLEDLASQIHRNAQILTDKFARVQLAMKYSGMALLVWLTFLLGLAANGAALKVGAG